MAEREHGGNPFGWVVLGFIVGVVATLGLLLFLSGAGYSSDEHDVRTEADEAATAAASAQGAPNAAPVVALPRKADAAPPAIAPTAPAGSVKPSDPVIDQQVSDDAAAAGMTSRAKPEDQPTN